MKVFLRGIHVRLGLLMVAILFGAIAVACTTESAPADTSPSTTSSATSSDIKDFALENIQVSVGTTVNWTNQDSARHTTTAGSGGSASGVWNSGPLGQGTSFSFTFNEAGTFEYFCQIHPSMTGIVTVQ